MGTTRHRHPLGDYNASIIGLNSNDLYDSVSSYYGSLSLLYEMPKVSGDFCGSIDITID